MFELKDIGKNVHINGIGSYRPNTREIGSDVMANATIIVDSYEGALKEPGDIVIPLNEGIIQRESIYASIDELVSEDEPEVLNFLAVRPLHTVVMASMIRDNGVVSPQNRGSFYACRTAQGELEGVALVGHVTVIEARTETALSTFARLTRHCLNTHLVRGERETIQRFWSYYANAGQEPRRISRELLVEQREAFPSLEPVADLRPARLGDLDQVLQINSAMAFQEGGTSPLNRDPGGFRHRTARRIEQNRVWVWVSEGRLIFKADIIAETPDVAYLEGVYVHAEERMKGYGRRCLGGGGLLKKSQTSRVSDPKILRSTPVNGQK